MTFRLGLLAVLAASALGCTTAAPDAGATASATRRDGGEAADASAGGDAGSDPALDAACTPTVVVQVEDTSEKGALFTSAVSDPEAFVQAIGRDVCRILYRDAAEVRAANQITLILRDDPSVAGWKSGDVGNITVMISTNHLAAVNARGDDVKTEIAGVLTHEMTHMYQNDDKAPGEGTYANLANVVEGIADAVRIRAKRPPTGAKPSKTGRWDDQGYWKPAYFLLWVDGQHPGFLHDLNASMAIGDGEAWSPASFASITGETVDALWTSYASATCCSSNDRSCCQ